MNKADLEKIVAIAEEGSMAAPLKNCSSHSPL